jgi:ATP-dependent Clp protease adaptor protein ClpS
MKQTTRRMKKMSDAYYDDDVAVADRDEIDVEPPRDYTCVMLNDNFTTVDFVVALLKTVFHKDDTEATAIMLDVHQKGKGVAYIGPYDICATKQSQSAALAREEGFPFKIVVEEA